MTHRLNPMCDVSLITDNSFDHILVGFRLLCLFSSHNPLLSINLILDGSFLLFITFQKQIWKSVAVFQYKIIYY